MSRLVIMGSGETAPTMVPMHRRIAAASPPGPAVLLDTPFAFQTNRVELVARIRRYFAQSVGYEVVAAPWPRRDAPAAERDRTLALLDQASWAFAGPGSPTYALRHWRETPLPGALADVARRGGTLVMGSAAAVTLGRCAVPVYEVYKVGADPQWVDGLDILGSLAGLAAAVIPHYDNTEGGTHDTRFCYLGEERLALLEQQLPAGVAILGVDEHTAVVLDLSVGTVEVSGAGALHVRRRGSTESLPAGSTTGLPDLAALLRGEPGRVAASAPPQPAPATHPGEPRPAGPPSLLAAAELARKSFDSALARRDVEGCVGAVLGLEETIEAWRSDTLQSDESDRARRVLRALVVRLGALAEVGARDPHEQLGPYVDLLVDLRTKAREARDFTTSDLVRDRLVSLGVEVHDTSSGSSWRLREV